MSDKLEKLAPYVYARYAKLLPDGVEIYWWREAKSFCLVDAQRGEHIAQVKQARSNKWKNKDRAMAYVAKRALIVRERGWEFNPNERSEKK